MVTQLTAHYYVVKWQDKIKVFDDKIKANEAHYRLDREATKIPALSSAKLEKYGYVTSEYLRCKPRVVKSTKLDYIPFVKILNKEWKEEDDKKHRFLKKLMNIEGKNEESKRRLRRKTVKSN